jgi:CheY-like chemotaxis protein
MTDNRELLRLLLCGANHQVREARNGWECLDSARRNPPDLIMVDLSMPGLDGWEVFRELKADSSTAHIPCVAVTAHTDPRSRACFAIGFSATSSASLFGPKELLLTVKRLVSE